MRPCSTHWNMMRESVDNHGLSSLIAHNGQQAVSNEIANLNQEPDPQNTRFDPLMSMYWHFMNYALECGGLYLMFLNQEENPDNEGHYCPLCEFTKHVKNFNSEEEINKVADQMTTWCREQKLIPGLQ